ncbi:MAG: transposase, partial [Candidatus Hadarchaeales archaeon]
LLLDRGFYSTEVILALKWRKIHFLMPAPRTPGIKRACRAFESGELLATIEYRLKGRKGDVKVWLAFLRRKTKDGMQTFAFISDLQFDPKTAASFYSKRWRIETNNRELKHFLARTTTRDMKIRRIYYGLAAFLYNTWIAMRHALEKLTKWEFKKAMLKSFVCPDEENASLSPG